MPCKKKEMFSSVVEIHIILVCFRSCLNLLAMDFYFVVMGLKTKKNGKNNDKT